MEQLDLTAIKPRFVPSRWRWVVDDPDVLRVDLGDNHRNVGQIQRLALLLEMTGHSIRA